MTIALIIVIIVAGTFFFMWQEEHEKFLKAEMQITDLKRQLKKKQKQVKTSKATSSFATIEKSAGTVEYVIKKPLPKVVKPLLDQTKLAELQKKTKASQQMLAEIFVQDAEIPKETITVSDNGHVIDILRKLFDKEIWTRNEIAELAGPEVMIGSLLEQINDYSCSKIGDIVVEEDADKIYVTVEYKEQLI